MRLLALMTCAATLLASTANAQPGAAVAADDQRCLLEMVALSNNTDPEAQKAGQEGVAYFVGRIAARNPGFDFNQLKATAKTMDDQAARTELQQRCGPMFEKSMQQLETALAPPPAAPGSTTR